MPRKCKVDGCRSGYRDDTEKLSIYRFPKDIEHCKLWLKCLPNAGLQHEEITNNMGVCARHWDWTSDVPMKTFPGGNKAPVIPPNNFKLPEIPTSSVPTPLPKPIIITSTRSLAEVRSKIPDEFDEFNARYSVDSSDFKEVLKERRIDNDSDLLATEACRPRDVGKTAPSPCANRTRSTTDQQHQRILGKFSVYVEKTHLLRTLF